MLPVRATSIHYGGLLGIDGSWRLSDPRVDCQLVKFLENHTSMQSKSRRRRYAERK